MKTNASMNRIITALATIMLISACTPVSSRIPGYLTTPKGQMLRNDAGQCWRTVEWRPALARMECDPEIVIRERELAAKDEEEKKSVEETKTDTALQPTGKTYEGLAGFDFVPTPVEDTNLPVATTRQITGDDGQTRTEIVYAPLSLSSDTSFRFGDDQLTTEGKDAIIELAGTLKRHRAGNIQIDVIGHTDRIGKASANMTLSRRRADAVKTQLIAEGIPGNNIRTAGMGASKPVTASGECPDRLVKCELIECLRPDRRVEIRVKAEIDSGKRTTVPVLAPPSATPKQGHAMPDKPEAARTARHPLHQTDICRA